MTLIKCSRRIRQVGASVDYALDALPDAGSGTNKNDSKSLGRVHRERSVDGRHASLHLCFANVRSPAERKYCPMFYRQRTWRLAFSVGISIGLAPTSNHTVDNLPKSADKEQPSSGQERKGECRPDYSFYSLHVSRKKRKPILKNLSLICAALTPFSL